MYSLARSLYLALSVSLNLEQPSLQPEYCQLTHQPMHSHTTCNTHNPLALRSPCIGLSSHYQHCPQIVIILCLSLEERVQAWVVLVSHLLASAEAANAHDLASARASRTPPGLLRLALRQGALATAAAARHVARALQSKRKVAAPIFQSCLPGQQEISTVGNRPASAAVDRSHGKSGSPHSRCSGSWPASPSCSSPPAAGW